MPRTSEIIAATPRGPVDPAAMAKTDAPVSLGSTWNSERWLLDQDGAAASRMSIDFRDVPTALQEAARVAVWSALVDPRGYEPPTIATVMLKMRCLDEVLAWVTRCNAKLADVDEDLFDCFVDELDELVESGQLVANGADRQTREPVLRRLLPWTVLHDQAASMRESGIDALTFDPFREKSAATIAKELSGAELRSVRPLPDEIAVPLVDAAARLAGTASDEIASALEAYVAVRLLRSANWNKNKDLAPLQFSSLEDDVDPWLAVHEHSDLRVRARIILDGVRLVVGAHIMMIYACGVPRPGELMSAASGIDVVTGLPTCVERTASASQLFDHYWMKAVREKLTDDEPEPDEWLIGCTVAGDDRPPEAVQAIIAIQRILEPLRRLGGEKTASRLLVSPGNGVLSVRKPESISPMGYGVMRNWMIRFVSSAIDWDALPDHARDGSDLSPYKRARGSNVTPRAWRKTLVQFMLRIDGRMTLPLARRLRHKVHTVLNEAYQDTDPGLLEEVDDAMARTLARTLVSISTGERKVVGWLGEKMEPHLDEIRALTRGLSGEPAIAIVQSWALERKLGLLAAGPGKCGLRLMPRHALCHQVAGTAGWWQTKPHPNRSDEHCANCKCCLVDTDHLRFWTSRYVAARAQVLTSRRLGREGESWTHAQQAEIARTMLMRLETRIPPDEEILT